MTTGQENTPHTRTPQTEVGKIKKKVAPEPERVTTSDSDERVGGGKKTCPTLSEAISSEPKWGGSVTYSPARTVDFVLFSLPLKTMSVLHGRNHKQARQTTETDGNISR